MADLNKELDEMFPNLKGAVAHAAMVIDTGTTDQLQFCEWILGKLEHLHVCHKYCAKIIGKMKDSANEEVVQLGECWEFHQSRKILAPCKVVPRLLHNRIKQALEADDVALLRGLFSCWPETQRAEKLMEWSHREMGLIEHALYHDSFNVLRYLFYIGVRLTAKKYNLVNHTTPKNLRFFILNYDTLISEAEDAPDFKDSREGDFSEHIPWEPVVKRAIETKNLQLMKDLGAFGPGKATSDMLFRGIFYFRSSYGLDFFMQEFPNDPYSIHIHDSEYRWEDGMIKIFEVSSDYEYLVHSVYSLMELLMFVQEKCPEAQPDEYSDLILNNDGSMSRSRDNRDRNMAVLNPGLSMGTHQIKNLQYYAKVISGVHGGTIWGNDFVPYLFSPRQLRFMDSLCEANLKVSFASVIRGFFGPEELQ